MKNSGAANAAGESSRAAQMAATEWEMRARIISVLGEIRNPKLEIRNKFEIQNPKVRNFSAPNMLRRRADLHSRKVQGMYCLTSKFILQKRQSISVRRVTPISKERAGEDAPGAYSRQNYPETFLCRGPIAI
jgi:hypothetical protein